jgi:predicted transcriptional regulator
VLNEETRKTILSLAERKIPKRQIAKLLKVSRNSVSQVIQSKKSQPKTFLRLEKAEPYREEILELHRACGGNLVRVHEELVIQGVQISYQALTAFCRRQQIGTEPKKRVGR